ncbi:MAG: hypothetical protein HUU37_01485, partial [Bdellovibrionales bacterium]|nr:hypothetical protein [Bdellovibrionales bacterium]
MRSQIPFFLLTSLLASSAAVSDSLPKWITGGSLEDASYRYIVCSQDGLDPEDIRQAAEAKCLSSAAKLNGVNITVKEKSVQSLTGVDASEVAEIEPKNKEAICTWTDRYLEKLASGYRIWLRCKVPKT